jgi:hypothetical protein
MFRAHCTASLGNHPVKTTLGYHSAEPLAIYITFDCEVRGTTWRVSRDLVIAGMTSIDYVGDGDVRLRRIAADGTWPLVDQVDLHLSSPGGEAFLLIPLADLSRFVGRTLVEMPLGDEQVDTNKLLTNVLSAA